MILGTDVCHDMRTFDHDVAIRFVMVCAIRMWMSCLVHRIHGRESCFGTTLWAMTSESWTTVWAMHDVRTINHDVVWIERGPMPCVCAGSGRGALRWVGYVGC